MKVSKKKQKESRNEFDVLCQLHDFAVIQVARENSEKNKQYLAKIQERMAAVGQLL